VLEIPSTLPTLDELLAVPLSGDGSQIERACKFLRKGVWTDKSIHVHSIHTEIEGGSAFYAPFAELLAAWKSDGVEFLTIEEICRPLLSAEAPARSERGQIRIPIKHLSFTTFPGRATPVATGTPAEE
jgi:hypothetical protein